MEDVKVLLVSEKFDVEKYGILGFNEYYEEQVMCEIGGDVEFEIIDVDDESCEFAIVKYTTL